MSADTPGPEPPLLNWSKGHEARAAAPCRYCIGNLPTYLRDDEGLPAHKTCAERALTKKAAKAAAQYQEGAF